MSNIPYSARCTEACVQPELFLIQGVLFTAKNLQMPSIEDDCCPAILERVAALFLYSVLLSCAFILFVLRVPLFLIGLIPWAFECFNLHLHRNEAKPCHWPLIVPMIMLVPIIGGLFMGIAQCLTFECLKPCWRACLGQKDG